VTTAAHRREAGAARAHLISVDPHLAGIVRSLGLVNPYVWEGVPLRPGELLPGLVLHIVSQQITTVFALDIYGRLEEMAGGRVTARDLATLGHDKLRGLGMSGAKARALTELGERISDGDLSLEALQELGDAAAEAALVSLRGVGPWSAEMFMLHELRRPDVFPAGDVGLRTAVVKLDGLAETPDFNQLIERSQVWRPYRSYAAAYLWGWLHRMKLRETERVHAEHRRLHPPGKR
jgi:DNA-3-methyladenine glycosylase II